MKYYKLHIEEVNPTKTEALDSTKEETLAQLKTFLDSFYFVLDEVAELYKLPKSVSLDKNTNKFILSFPKSEKLLAFNRDYREKMRATILDKHMIPEKKALSNENIKAVAGAYAKLPSKYIKFFSESGLDNYDSPEIHELHDAFINELSEKQKSATGCSKCAKAAIIKKYATKLLEVIK